MKYKFSEILADETKLGKKISQGDYLVDGQFPIIDQGQKEIAGYSNETAGLFRDVPAIIFGDHTRVLKFVNKPFFLGADGVKLLKPKRNEDNAKYLFYALKNVKIPNTGYNRHFKWLKEARIEIPERKHQDAVVKILDSVTHLISLRQRQAEKLDELVKARFVEMFGDFSSLNTRWPLQPLSVICHKINDGEHGSVPRVAKGYIFLNAKNIRKDGSIDWKQTTFISKENHLRIYKRCNPELGDVLLTTTGTIGNVSIVSRSEPFSMDRGITLLKNNREIMDSVFLSVLLRSRYLQSLMTKNVHASAIGHLFINQVKQLPVIVPPISLQTDFANFVHEVDREKERIQKSAALLETLKRSLMQQYFG